MRRGPDGLRVMGTRTRNERDLDADRLSGGKKIGYAPSSASEGQTYSSKGGLRQVYTRLYVDRLHEKLLHRTRIALTRF